MDHRETLALFEQGANGSDFDRVPPLIDQDAVYWFTDGSFESLNNIRRAFEQTWVTIREETYHIEDPR